MVLTILSEASFVLKKLPIARQLAAVLTLLVCDVLSAAAAGKEAEPGCRLMRESSFKGWRSVCLSNGMVTAQVVPQIGGRVMSFRFGTKEWLWVNPRLMGLTPPSSGLGPESSWLNFGGDKLWPAPQGWDNDQQWPGPPDAVLDGQPYKLEKLRTRRGQVAIRLTSGKDLRSGIQFSRVIRMYEGSTRVTFEATMKNIDTKPRRWGIWAHTQLDGAKAYGGGHNPLLSAWCPINPKSHFPRGYNVIFGSETNASFQSDQANGLMRVQYQYRVGKIGLDSDAGWVACVDGANGCVLVQRSRFEPGHEYPDGASVEFWLNGVGSFRAWGKENIMTDDPVRNPYVFESELLSPFAALSPGQSYTWQYEWCTCNIGGDYPVIACSDAGVVLAPLVAKASQGSLQLFGRFGVFLPGRLQAVFFDARGRRLRTMDLQVPVSPLHALILGTTSELPAGATTVSLFIFNTQGKRREELATAPILPTAHY